MCRLCSGGACVYTPNVMPRTAPRLRASDPSHKGDDMNLRRATSTFAAILACSTLAACSSEGEEDTDADRSGRLSTDQPTRIGDKRDARIPRGSIGVGKPNREGAIAYRTLQPGTLYIVDQTADAVIHT